MLDVALKAIIISFLLMLIVLSGVMMYVVILAILNERKRK